MTNLTSNFHGINDIIYYYIHMEHSNTLYQPGFFIGLFQDVFTHLYIIEFATVMNQT